MSDYPVFDQLIGTEFRPFDDTVTQTTGGGESKIIAAFKEATINQGKVGEFTVLHDVDSADRTELETHYSDNRRNSFNFVEKARPEITWTCIWGPNPQFARLDKLGNRFEARSILYAKGNDE